jgi:1-deoxy-D-xylulose-5-phosphate reductoisomerase
LIEAHYLFRMPSAQIDVVVHPQSIIHSMVEFVDGSVLAQLGSPDMRIPIAYALAWPERMATPAERLDFAGLGRLDFESPDLARFPALKLARDALEAGGAAPIILNAANEIAVEHFLRGQIGFTEIASIVEQALGSTELSAPASIDDVIEIDRNVRAHVLSSLSETCR